MEHHGGCGADNDSGDGSGVMTSIPWDLFNSWASEQGMTPFDQMHTGIGMVFLPKDDAMLQQAQTVIMNIFKQEGLQVLGWRSVPVDTSVVGCYATKTMPNIMQLFVQISKEENVDDIERELFICRKLIERAAALETWGSELYFCSLSNQTMVYKGMLRSEDNLNWMQSRETSLKSPVWHGHENELRPFGNPKVILPSPVLNEGELESLLKDALLKPKVLPTFFDIRKGIEGSLEKTLYKLCEAADEAVRNGSQLLVLSDRSDELDATRPAIPILLAVGSVHQHLIQNGLRIQASIVADTAQCFSTISLHA